MTEPGAHIPCARYRGTRVAVLGAAGFIGRWVARALAERGAELCLVVRNAAVAMEVLRPLGLQGGIVAADLAQPGAVYNVLRPFEPAILFNLVGYGVDRSERDQVMAYRTNAHLVAGICQAMAELCPDGTWPGQQIVHVGSALEYGSIAGDLAEGSAPRPTTCYGQSKLAGTAALARCAQTYGLRGLTARPFTVYGPGEHQGRLLPSLMAAARTEEAIALTAGRQERDFIWVGDVAEGLLRLGLCAAKPGSIVNLATGRLTPVRRFAETAADLLGMPRDRLVFGKLPTRPEEMVHAEVDVERLRALTGWLPTTSIAEGIRRTVVCGRSPVGDRREGLE